MRKTEPKPQDGRAGEARRKHRRRPMPRWLQSSQELDAIARARCLMVLSVLSGETPVSDAIAQAKISRATYYQMETRGLSAMLAALNPLASTSEDGSADLSAAAARIEQLQGQLKRLEQDKRRSQRLLLLVRKSMRSPLMRPRRGRPPKDVLQSLIGVGKRRSRGLKAKASARSASIPTEAGESSP